MKPDYTRLAASLSNDDFPAGQLIRLRVISGSMRPLIWPGDVVVVVPAEHSALKLGDIVLLRGPQDFVTHRLIAFNRESILAKGDAVWVADPPWPVAALVGRVLAVEKPTAAGSQLTVRRWDFSAPIWRWLHPALGLFHRALAASVSRLRDAKCRLFRK